MNSNKTPYELRFDVLEMAKNRMLESYYEKRERIVQDWNARKDACLSTGSPPPDYPEYPEFPSDELILKSAETLYAFVINKTTESAGVSGNPCGEVPLVTRQTHSNKIVLKRNTPSTNANIEVRTKNLKPK